ncbi:hypothetical protein KU406_23285, partial [Salmonella enterica subsp. enterica serovar Montevideo]|nr:hypothetical protein [Salmonella enterica subsp. enterica serovar Montevideo]
QKGKKFTPESVSRLLEKISAGGYGDKRLSPKESEVLRLFAEGCLESGMDSCLSKPVTLDVLKQTLAVYAERVRKTRA